MYDGTFTSNGDWLYPNLWDGCSLAAFPGFGPTGLAVYDWSGNYSAGIITGAIAVNAWTQSNGLWAYKSNATSDYISFGSISGIISPAGGSASISVWFYKPTGTATAKAGFFDTNGHQFGISTTGGVTYFSCDNGSAGVYPNVTDSRTGWNHYVINVNGTTITGFINGIQQTLTGGNVTTLNVTGTLTIGRQLSNGTYNSSGILTDDFRLYSKRILSAGEIQTLYNGGYGKGIAYTPDDLSVYKGSINNRRRRLLAAGVI
jgi:hypothetical protein